MSALPIMRGPADPDNFRIKVGRFKERWYHDPLPGCDVAPATDESWPSATTIKGAWPKFLHYWSAGEAAKCAVKETANWRGMTEAGAIEYISGAHTRTRDAAGDRGTLAHEVVEALILGRPIDAMVEARIGPWIGTLRQFVADTQPRLLFSEVVTISRGLGAGGTIDAGLEFPADGSRRWVDWKTREAGKHDPYDDDAAQLGIYTQPDAYLIVNENGRAKRIPLPQLDSGLIVTVAPDGYRLHPVDLNVAHENARTLRAFWAATRTSAVGKPIVLTTGSGTVAPSCVGTAPAATPDDGGLRAEHARQRLVVLAERKAAIVWPAGIPTFKEQRLSKHIYTHDELLRIEAALSEAEKADETPFPPDEPKVAPERLATLIGRLEALPGELLAEATAFAKKHLMPRLSTNGITIRHADLLEPVIAELEQRAQVQSSKTLDLLGGYGDDPQLAEAIVRLAGCADGVSVDDETAVNVAALVEALDDGLIVVNYTETSDVTFVCADTVEPLVVEIGGGARARAVVHCKTFAEQHGLTRYRAVGAYAADPLFVALLVHTSKVPV